jgi:hypothetical protein
MVTKLYKRQRLSLPNDREQGQPPRQGKRVAAQKALCRKHGLKARVGKSMGVKEGSGVIGEIYIGRVCRVLALFALGWIFFGCGRGVPSVNARVD